jgi:hypothetical protein
MAISSASAPQLKPLVKSILGGSSFQRSEDYAKAGSNSNSRNLSQSDARNRMSVHRLYGSRSRGNDIPMGNYKGHVTSTAGHGSANTSQENIIGTGIMKTTNVKVDVEMGPGNNNSEDSLRRLEFGL